MSHTAIDPGTALILADPVQSVSLYQRMCAAIAECARIDQVREIRNRAMALARYTHESKNFEAEAQLSAIRMRAERRAGELLSEMAENGERQMGGGDRRKAALPAEVVVPTLANLGVVNNQSWKWQQLAKIPAPEFEQALAEPGVKTTHKLIAAHRPQRAAAPFKKSAKAQSANESNADRHRRFICEAVVKLADNKIRSSQEIVAATGRTALDGFIERARMLPWLTVEHTLEGYRFVVDEELRAICEDRAPRPQLSGASVHAFVKRLTKEIYAKRKENQEKNKAIRWTPDNTLKTQQKWLLDWIEMELSRLTELMASSGSDVMSAIRTQNHPSGDEEGQYVSQEKHPNRTTDPRSC